MPAADFRIHEYGIARINTNEGLSLREDVLFTNSKGQEKSSLQKRSEKVLRKLRPALQRILLADETILYVMPARSPLSVLEQLTAAWWTAMLAACAVVVTNKRILFFPIKRDGTWRESIRTLQWGDLQELKPNGLIVRNITFKLKNGTKTTYANFTRADAKKLAVIAAALIPVASGELTSAHSILQLCPDCRGILTPGHYSCSTCSLTFKNEKTMVMRSILLPGGGYFYTGHPLVAIIPAIVEGIFILEILLFLFAGLVSPNQTRNLLYGLVMLAIFWALETGVTILHCRTLIRHFIPEKRPLSGAQRDLAANTTV